MTKSMVSTSATFKYVESYTHAHLFTEVDAEGNGANKICGDICILKSAIGENAPPKITLTVTIDDGK